MFHGRRQALAELRAAQEEVSLAGALRRIHPVDNSCALASATRACLNRA